MKIHIVPGIGSEASGPSYCVPMLCESLLIHDDLLATGGTAVAAAELIQKSGGKVAGFSFVVELSFLKGKEVLNKYSEYNKSIVNY